VTATEYSPGTHPLQLGVPGAIELLVVLLVFALAVIPAILVYRDASRRDAEVPAAWALATLVAAWSLVGLPVVAVLYYVLVVRDDSDAPVGG
jgi:hypothetical protein